MSEQRVEILGAEPGKKGLHWYYDPKTGQYFAPSYPEGVPYFDGIVKLHEQGLTGKGIKCAILDTGMTLGHPWIKRSVEESVDLTGEGPEDLNGHGTLMTLLYLLGAPDSTLLNIKVAGSDGRGEEKNLIRGIEITVEKGAQTMSLSLGVYHRKWGLLDCKADCSVCQAAEKAAEAGVIISAAAGNEPGKTYCPAKLGLLKGLIISVAAFDFENGFVPPYSGKGEFAVPSQGRYPLIPVDTNGHYSAPRSQ